MCGRLDRYLLSFSRLNPNKNRKVWTKLTNHSSPYKQFLLLSVLDHITTGSLTKNFVEPSFELTETFQKYISLLPPMNRKATISYPFYHLSSSDFWALKPKRNQPDFHGTMRSIEQFQKAFYGVQIEKDLFVLLQMPNSREKLRDVLINTYFASEFQQVIRDQSYINCESAKYSDTLISNFTNYPPETSEQLNFFHDNSSKDLQKDKVRDQGFRRAIVKLYDHRCALCGIKMMTSEGHTIVDAAHIKPWSESYNDHPTNGLALCKLCHWSFDEGLMSVDKQYQVLISPDVKKDPNLPGHILTLSDRPMFRPAESRFWPDQESFDWHRKKCFRIGG